MFYLNLNSFNIIYEDLLDKCFSSLFWAWINMFTELEIYTFRAYNFTVLHFAS